MSRPRLAPTSKRSIRKEVRFTADEYDRLCRVALRLRLDISTFIRLMALPLDPVSVRIKNTEHV